MKKGLFFSGNKSQMGVVPNFSCLNPILTLSDGFLKMKEWKMLHIYIKELLTQNWIWEILMWHRKNRRNLFIRGGDDTKGRLMHECC